MSEISVFKGAAPTYAAPIQLPNTAQTAALVQAAPLLEADVVTNHVPRLTVGHQSQVGSLVTYARLRDARELGRFRSTGRSANTQASSPLHPLLPDPETHDASVHVAAADVTPQHVSDIHAQALAIALHKLPPQESAIVLRALRARQVAGLQRQAAQKTSGSGRARMRAPGSSSAQRSIFEPDVLDHDAVDTDAAHTTTLAPTMQSHGVADFAALLAQQRAVDAASNARLYLGGRVDGDLRQADVFARLAPARPAGQNLTSQATALNDHESQLNHLLKANSASDMDDLNQARRFRQTREAEPLTHGVLGQLVNEVGNLHDRGARESEIVALLDKVQPGQAGYINDLAVHLQSVQDPELKRAGEARLQALLQHA